MRYNFKLFDLEVDKIKETFAYYVDLQDDRMIYSMECITDRPPRIGAEFEEEDLYSEEDIYNLETCIFKRESLHGTTMYFTKTGDTEIYIVTICILSEDPIEIKFLSKKEANQFKKALLEYIFEKK